MAGIGDIVQKAFYLGVGLAATAGEKASELRVQAQKLAEEMVAKGEMNADEARRFVDDMVKKAQQPQVEQQPTSNTSKQPRQIEILSEEEETAKGDAVDAMRQQVEALQEELRRLKRDRS
jgi:polyhydroxyalkanoate synthesis regulator phasin